MELGLLDERNAVIVMLLIERMRGDGSRYAPYIQLLPERCEGSSSSGGSGFACKHSNAACYVSSAHCQTTPPVDVAMAWVYFTASAALLAAGRTSLQADLT
jgi:hypothetical protein